MSRFLVALVTAFAVLVSSTAVAAAAPPADPPGPPIVTPITPPPGRGGDNAANVLHCNAIEGGSGVTVVNNNPNDDVVLGNCDLGG